jgi:GNAT superfamily N-acetyltransferase
VAIETLVTRDPEALILAVEEGEIVGTIIAGWDGWRCHLYRLAVAPHRRRAGIGRRLIAAAEERLGRQRGTRADAMVLDGLTPSMTQREWLEDAAGSVLRNLDLCTFLGAGGSALEPVRRHQFRLGRLRRVREGCGRRRG